MSAIDWTPVAAALSGAIPGALAAVYGFRIHKGTLHLIDQVRVPSGEKLGDVVERTHDLAAINTLQLKKLNGDTKEEHE